MRWYCTFPCGRVGRCRNIIGDAQPPDRIPGRGALLFRGSVSGGASVASRSTRSHPEHGVAFWAAAKAFDYHGRVWVDSLESFSTVLLVCDESIRGCGCSARTATAIAFRTGIWGGSKMLCAVVPPNKHSAAI